LSVIVTAPERVYYVGGEVKTPNRYLWQTRIKVSQAIQSAGDFTEFANKKKVKLTRKDGSTYIVNCVDVLDHPEQDLWVFPGDTIHVPRHW
jgi:protein involved in polysaccharide export with SLBB domain